MPTDYVKQYLKADVAAADAEDKVTEYTGRAEENHWACCRIAHEAVDSGEFSRSSFSRAVNKAQSTISRQVAIWDRWGHVALHSRPTYLEAMKIVNPGSDRSNADKVRSGARNLPAPDKRELFTELAGDPDVVDDPGTRRRAAEGMDRGRRQSRPRSFAEPSPVTDEFAEVAAVFERNNLPAIIAEDVMDLRRRLENVPEWMRRFGHLKLTEDGEALGVLMDDTLTESHRDLEAAFKLARGGDIAHEAEAFLADQPGRG